MINFTQPTMTNFRCMNDFSSITKPQSLMSQANAQQWYLGIFDYFTTNTKIFWFFWTAWTWLNDDVIKFPLFQIIPYNLIIVNYSWILSVNFCNQLVKVKSIRIVVINNQGFQVKIFLINSSKGLNSNYIHSYQILIFGG